MGHVFSIRYCGLNCNKAINLSSAFHLISEEQEQCTMPYVIPTGKFTPRQTAHDARSSKISFRDIINLPFQYVVEERLHAFRISKISPSSTETTFGTSAPHVNVSRLSAAALALYVSSQRMLQLLYSAGVIRYM